MEITSKFPGRCKKCGDAISVGVRINWERGNGATHVHCPAMAAATVAARPAVQSIPIAEQSPYKLYGGEGYGCHGWTVGQVVHVAPEKYDGHEYLYVLKAKKNYYADDGMSFGVGDERGHVYSAGCRPATEAEAAPLIAQIAAQEKRKNAEKRIKEIKKIISETGERPENADPESESNARRILDTQNIYGSGDWLVISDTAIWYVRNNGMDGDNWSNNNVRTGGAGAIGWKIAREEKIVSEILEIEKLIG